MKENSWIISVVITCIVGVAIVSFFAFKYAPFKESFSELYFENQEDLPERIEAGEEKNFAFTVVSHRNEKSLYHCIVKFDEKILKEEEFTLMPGEKKRISASFKPLTSSIAFVNEKTETERADFTLDKIGGFIFSEEDRGFLPIYRNSEGVFIPIKLPYSGLSKSSILLKIDPGSKDTHCFSYTKKDDVEDVEEEKEEEKEEGYDIINEKQTIINDYGKISFSRKVTTSQYRYKKKRISAEVSNGEKDYEIHFWLIVEEPKIQD